MQLVIDEQEQEHIYVCLKAGKKDFAKAKKQLELLAQPTQHIEEAIELNQRLARSFNPKSEEEARAASRKRDPAQMDLEDQVRAHARRLERRKRTLNETDGVPEWAPAGEPLSDYELQTKLGDGDCYVRTEDLAGWTSSEREIAYDFARRGGAKGVPTGDGWPGGTPPHVAAVALRDHELDALIATGPYRVDEETREGDVVWYVVGRDDPNNPDEYERDSEFDNDIDADVRAARLNQGLLPETSMTDEALGKLQDLGIGDGAAPAETPTDVERESMAAPSAGYPSTETTEKKTRGGKKPKKPDAWTSEAPVRVSEDQVQAVRAAVEAT